jgi:hypothetical protein
LDFKAFVFLFVALGDREGRGGERGEEGRGREGGEEGKRRR